MMYISFELGANFTSLLDVTKCRDQMLGNSVSLPLVFYVNMLNLHCLHYLTRIPYVLLGSNA